ncbi:unnamed protein product [Eruca vesicaria subsp. sativa]|uniref:PB1 domain-containing protein n=1 Tax=Eruca vesicaria subsp. sativa TaxID=29727 RepID=A0ABC8IWX8_ERUVS|nr:unnamed protein product [Eruca vesicaria subsp. sativa]
MEKLKKKLEPETSQSQIDNSKVEALASASKAQTLKEEGNKFFQKRDFEAAMLRYTEAIKLLPKDHVEVSHIQSNMASCYMHSEPGEYTKAIYECDLALSITPDHTKALLKRARCYEVLNKLDLALRDVCMVSKLDPNNPMASEIAEKLRKTLESKGLRVNDDSVIELSPDYVEPIEVSPVLWAEELKERGKKNKKSKQVLEKNNNLESEKGKEKIIDKQSKKKVKGKQEEKVIIEDKSIRDVKFVYSEDIRIAELPLNCTLFQLREVVHERFPNLRAVHIKYKDQEGDLVTITTDEELRMSEVSAERSLETKRFYVMEVSPDQDPFYGRLVEMKKLKTTADSFKTKVNGKGKCKIEDWMVEFARLFKIKANVDFHTCLNLQELGMKMNSEAMEEVVTSDEAQGPFDRAAQQFQEVAARSLLKLGNVYMTRARKRLSLLRGGSEQVEAAYQCAQRDQMKAKEMYQEAMRIKPNLFEVLMALGLQQFEEARLSWYYVIVRHLDLKTWPYETVVQLYRSAERNIKRAMEGLKNQASPTDEAAKLKKSWLDVLSCALLYERSIMEYKLDLPTSQENLEAAVKMFGSEVSHGRDNTDI